MRAHHERARQRASFNAWVCGLASHASVFLSVSFQYQSANSPALVQWRFVCICVRVYVFLCLSALPTRLLLSLPHPQHSGLCGQTMPTTNLTPCMFHHHSFIFLLPLSVSLSLVWLIKCASYI